MKRSTSVTLRNDLTELVREIKFEDLNLTADFVAPVVSVIKDAGHYPVLDRESVMKVMETRRKNDGSFPRSEWKWSDDSYVTYEYGFEEEIDLTEALKDSEYINQEAESSELAWQGLLLGRESRVAEAMFNTTTFTGATNTDSITNGWDSAATCTPWKDIDDRAKIIRSKCALPKSALTLVTSEDNIEYMMLSAEVKGYFQYSGAYADLIKSTIKAKAAFLAGYLGIKRIVPVQSLYDTSGIGSSANIGKFWSNEYAMLCYQPEGKVTLKTQCLIKQLNWSAYSTDFVMEEYEVPERRKLVIRAREHRGIKVNTDYGFLIQHCKTTVDTVTGV
jgi:hypothetical protein